MKSHYEIAIIGAGPAGMAAASEAARHAASVLLLDEQPVAGGQIYRNLTCQTLKDRNILGEDYYNGQSLVDEFAEAQIDHVGSTTVWQVSSEREIGVSKDGAAGLYTADQVIIATGAQERPFPIPGWTLPGVMMAGGAQVLLKSSGVALPNIVFAGTGPLLYLIAYQYMKAGVPIQTILDTSPRSNIFSALPALPAALLSIGTLLKGQRWISELRDSGVQIIKSVEDLKLSGNNSVETVEYLYQGKWQQIKTSHVLLHQGVVPNINLAMAAGCEHQWNDQQLCWHAKTDRWAETNISGVAIAGDGVGIGGAKAAEYRGRIAAFGALSRCEKIDLAQRNEMARPFQSLLAKELKIRPFLDIMFRPTERFRIPEDDNTIVCRCEEVTAEKIREAIDLGCSGPNQLKSFTRCGMGPCQGRFCGLTVSEMIANSRGVSVSEVDPLRIRPPVKPLMLSELANLVSADPEEQ